MIVRSLAEPSAQNSFALAIVWVEATTLGTLATTLAVIAVAGVGLTMLSGRLDVRRGIAVIAGCFVLFGASALARGILLNVSVSSDGVTAIAVQPELPVPRGEPRPRPASPAVNDPYAGAAVQR
jgi:type IV secretory pathway VirB2 component (pilin)